MAVSRPSERQATAFTLIELLVVVAVIVLVMAFTVPALTGLSKSGGVTSSGRSLSNALTIARSQAINQRTYVRLEIATAWPPNASEAFRKITIAQYDPVLSTFRQVGKWETLATGTVIEAVDVYSHPPVDIGPTPTPTPSRGTYFTDLFKPTGTLDLDTNCSYGGQAISCAYFEFLPTGALNSNSSPVWARIAAGVRSSGAVTHTARGTNYADCVVDNIVGRIAVNRP